ncbi:MAG: type 1 glutamine amidotransferase [Flavobacteriaceae bacterium]
MSILVVENFADSDLGALAPLIGEAGAAADIRRMHLGASLPGDCAAHDRLIVLGGGQNALDDAAGPWFPALTALVRDFHAARKPVLGICLGSQLLARAFGGGNVLGRPLEFGYLPVAPTADAASDPVFRSLTAPAPSFHWHNDTVTLPKGATHLASSEMTPVQAWRMGAATYAVQFHFEADAAHVRHWARAYRAYIGEHIPDWPARMEAEIARAAPAADAFGAELARRWLALPG